MKEEAFVFPPDAARVGWGGTRRCCFRLGASGLCVKFYKPQSLYDAEKVKPSIRRDIDRRRFSPRLNSSCQEVATLALYRRLLPPDLIAAHFPPVCERVFHPDYGWGVRETYYTNPDGSAVIPYEFEIARQTSPRTREIIYAQAKALLRRLAAAAAPFYEPGNFHTRLLPDGAIETKIVDFEPTSKTLLRPEAFIPALRRLKLRRKAARYLAHIRAKYGVADKSLDQLAAEGALGTAFAAFQPLHAGNSSRNYKATAPDGTARLVKFATRKHLADHLSFLNTLSPAGADATLIPRLVCAADDFLVTEFAEGRSVHPADFTPAHIQALVAGHARLMRELNPAPDPSGEGRIHGDFHYRNFFFAPDPSHRGADPSGGAPRLSAVFDFERSRRGLPTEDLLRVFLHAMERTRFWRVSRLAALRRNLAAAVRAAPYPREMWREALNRYQRHKVARRRAKARHGLFLWIENLLRAPLYRRLRTAITSP